MKKIAACALVAGAASTLGIGTLAAQPAPRAAPLAGTQLAGQGTLRFLGLAIYRARLWVSPGFEPGDYTARPLALEFDYGRHASAQVIAERSIQEMRRIGSFSAQQGARWQQALQAALPDVKSGDRLVGIYRPDAGVVVELDGRTVGEVKDPAFARLFIGIWLSPQSSEPRLRQALLAGTRKAPP